MAEPKKVVAPRQYDSLPKDYIGKRGTADNILEWPFKKGLLRKKQKDGPDRYALRPARPMNDEERAKFVSWMTLPLISESGFRQTSQFATRWSNNSFDPVSGLFVPAEFDKCVDKYSARGETIKALKEEKEELNQDIIDVSKDTSLDVATKAKRFEEIAARLSEIQDALDFKQGTPDDEDEDAVPASA